MTSWSPERICRSVGGILKLGECSSNVFIGRLVLFGTVAVDDARFSGDRKRGVDEKAEQCL